MAFYEHTFIGKQDISDSEINSIIEDCKEIIKKHGKVLKTEKWGLLNLSHKIKKNKKGIFIHFKFESKKEAVSDVEKKLSLENKVIRFLTVKYEKLDLDKVYFEENKK